MLNRRHFLAALAGASVPLVRTRRGVAQSSRLAPRRWPAVQDVLDAHVGRRTIAGAVTALSYADAPVRYLAAGRIALDSDRRPDENSIYRMYSTTKVVTGIAALQLVQDGKQAARLTTNYEASADGLTAIDGGESSVWLRPPSLVAGGGGLVSTARDFARFTGMLLGQGTFDGVQVLRGDIARLACSNLLPQEVSSDFGYGAGMRITRFPKERSSASPGPVGTLSFGGAAGCRWMVDPVRRGTMVFMRQRMPGPANLSLWDELHAAVDADLA